MNRTSIYTALLVSAFAGCQAGNQTEGAPANTPNSLAPAPTQAAAPARDGVDVLLCDGETQVFVPKGTAGTEVAGALMSEWLKKNPNATWDKDVRERHGLMPAADNSHLVGQGQGQTYGSITERDVALWKRETELVALAGARVFHNAGELGSTVGVSCDMCHPHASNTHPETYPKFQEQLGRVALLRDMINWCLEHPVRAKPMEPNDPRMRALESYILAQRSGKALQYGKH
jgi:thiosulfate dehydrogenase